jgi:hypothetical protein
MARKARWSGLARRLRSAVESGLCSLAPLAGVPWPDMPAEAWPMECDAAKAAGARPYCPGAPLSPMEELAWLELRERLTGIS